MKLTQCEMIMRHLQVHGTITAGEALSEYGIMRLASRISDLKKSGAPIRKRMVKAKNRFDETVCFAEYSLEDEES